ncbi:MAG TPA: hypothetical protein VFW23_09550 [Tepidisphaeraceae bacterium]|nr:hypothetical protein [Tepidisphaeraceae bacterium]
MRQLSPASVTQLSGGQGIVLQWGVLASWGTSREVVICALPTIAPPRDDYFQWKQVRDGVYAAFENGD